MHRIHDDRQTVKKTIDTLINFMSDNENLNNLGSNFFCLFSLSIYFLLQRKKEQTRQTEKKPE